MLRDTISTTSRKHWEYEPANKQKGSSEEELRLDREPDNNSERNDNTYDLDKTVRHVSARPRRWHVVQWYEHNKADITTKLSTKNLDTLSISTGGNSLNGERKRPYW